MSAGNDDGRDERGKRPVLLADIGGTNARFALLRGSSVDARADLAVANYPTPQAAIEDYLGSLGTSAAPRSGILAVAGPVAGGRGSLTNASWRFHADELSRALKFPVRLANDFEAQAWAAAVSRRDERRQIGGLQAPANAALAVIGPGTGLGMAGFLPEPGARSERLVQGRVVVGEGGHMTLGARDAEQADLLGRLGRQFGHVSAERVVSGPGLLLIFRVLTGEAAGGFDTPEAVVAAARNGHGGARQALDMFFDLLGVAAGNLALVLGARGGVYLTGSMITSLEEELAASRFREAFEAKGRMREYMAAIPCFVLRIPDPAFTGLAAMAAPLGCCAEER